ncbi:hypothetical protein ACQYE5_002961 [Enterobacter cancerogenus]
MPFYKLVVNGRDGTVRGMEGLAHSLIAQVIGHINTLADRLPEGLHTPLASHIVSPAFMEEFQHFLCGFTPGI